MRWLAILVAAACFSCQLRERKTAEAGLVDLSDASPGAYEIRGQWIFFPGRFLSETRDPGTGIPVPVPGSWNSYEGSARQPGFGFGSYRLIAQTPDRPIAVSMMEQGTAMRVFANGTKVCEAGQPSSDPAAFRADTLPVVCAIGRVSGGRLDLVIEIANFNYRKGGMWNPPVIGDHDLVDRDFEARRDAELMLVALLFVMAVYHLMLYVYHRADSVPLWFGLFSFSVFARTISTNFRVITEFLPGLPFEVYNRIEFLSWFWIPALGLRYTAQLFPGRISPFIVKIVFAFAAAQTLTLVSPAQFYSQLVPASQAVSAVIFLLCLAAPVSALRARVPGAVPFLLSFFLALLAVGNDVLHTNEIIRTAHIGPYGLFFVVMAQSLIISRNLLRTHKLLIKSDDRYRVMVEGSRRLVFSLDRDFRFITANRAMLHILGVTSGDLVGRRFLDFVQAEDRDARQVVRAALEEAVRAEQSYRFSVGLMQVIGTEPVVCRFAFEVVETAGSWELLGKAESDLHDNLLPRFVSERQHFEIANSLVEAEEISHRLVQNVARYADAQQTENIRMGLREIIINAIEHGNLAVSFEDKTKAQQEGDYLKFLQTRCQLPDYRSRIVRIAYSLNASRVIYRITDQGDGFDYQTLLREIESRQDGELEHGRGILITLGLFDVVRFTEPGNNVFLMKRLGTTAET